MFILQIAKHSPESCPAHDPKYRTVTVNWYEKVEAIAAKHRIKVVGVWTAPPAHAIYAVFEAPSMDAFMGLSMEPEWMALLAFNTIEVMPVSNAKDVLAMLKRAK